MFQAKLIYFVVGLTLVCTTDFATYDGYDIKRSAVCLIQRVAQHNHITAKFEKVHSEQNNDTTHVECELDLGDEHYFSNATSLAKAKEKVARQAYALTKYTKPPLENRTCAVNGPGKKIDISLLEEYAHVIHKHILYTEGHRSSNGTFEISASLDGKTASGIGYKKKLAKRVAATNLLQIIGRITVIDSLIAKYNQTKYHKMEPTLRLRKIARVIDPTGDGIYTKKNEVLERQEGKGQVKRITVDVIANDYVAAGTGNTFEEAKRSAAANLLRSMDFTNTYQHRKHRRS